MCYNDCPSKHFNIKVRNIGAWAIWFLHFIISHHYSVWSLPPVTTSTATTTTTARYSPQCNDENVVNVPPRITIWSRLRVGMSQMFRRVAVFFSQRNNKKKRTSSCGSSSSGRYWDSIEDEADFIEVIRVSSLDSAIVTPDTPTHAPSRGTSSKPVNLRRRGFRMAMIDASRRAAVFWYFFTEFI